eukprot:2042983-Pyramimonas_sp.AAC.1
MDFSTSARVKTGAEHTPGHIVILLQVIVAQQLDLSIRQAASIHFKQLLHKGWEPKSGVCSM